MDICQQRRAIEIELVINASGSQQDHLREFLSVSFRDSAIFRDAFAEQATEFVICGVHEQRTKVEQCLQFGSGSRQ